MGLMTPSANSSHVLDITGDMRSNSGSKERKENNMTNGQLQLLKDVVTELEKGGKEISGLNIRDLIMKRHFDFSEDWPSTHDIDDFVSRQQSA